MFIERAGWFTTVMCTTLTLRAEPAANATPTASTGVQEVTPPTKEVAADEFALGKPAPAPQGSAATAPNGGTPSPQIVAPDLAQSAPIAPGASQPNESKASSPTAPPNRGTAAEDAAETWAAPDQPSRLPFKGEVTMPGYVLREQPRWWMVALGGALFGLGYVGGVGIAADGDFGDGLGYAAIPVAGPWVALAMHDGACDDISCESDNDEALAAVGVVQDIGALLLAIGLSTSRQVWIRQDLAWTVAPLLGKTRSGVVLSGEF